MVGAPSRGHKINRRGHKMIYIMSILLDLFQIFAFNRSLTLYGHKKYLRNEN